MYPICKDEFYNELFALWANIHYTLPKDNEEICRQELWNNANLQTDGCCFHYKDWKNNKINFIQDILGNDGCVVKKKNLENKYNITCKQLNYEILNSAIPHT